MHSSISNFDLMPLAKAIGAGTLLIAFAWWILPDNLAFDELPVLGAETNNELIVEQYSYEHTQKPIVLVGSSIQTLIPPPQCRPANVATIYLQAKSGTSG